MNEISDVPDFILGDQTNERSTFIERLVGIPFSAAAISDFAAIRSPAHTTATNH